MPEDERRPEDEFFAEFESMRARILGALLDAVSAALRNVATVRLDRSPRMADFVKWITAAESGLGWEPGAFLSAYQENRRDVSESAFEADVVAVAVHNFVKADRPDGFEGTATELLKEINNWTTDSIRNSRSWPQNPSQLGNRIARAKPLLAAKGFFVERRHSGARTITIVPPKAS